MSEYSVGFTAKAEESLGSLSTFVAQRILDKIRWLASHFDATRPVPLAGEFSGVFKLRAGDYRVIYTFDRDARTITIQRVGHRRDIYKNA